MKKVGNQLRKRNESIDIQADIPLGKLLLGLSHLTENACSTEKCRLVHVNLSKAGVERPTRDNGCCEIILWNQLENQNPVNSHISKLFTRHNPHKDSPVVTFKKYNSIEVKFTICKTYFSIGIDADLLSSKNFFRDVFNLITYRGGRVRLRVRLQLLMPIKGLNELISGDHGYTLVPMDRGLIEFADFISSLWVIVLKESSSSDLTTRSSSDFSNMEDLSLWKVWNWRLNDYYPTYDTINDEDMDMYQCEMYGYEVQDLDAIMDDDVTPYDVEMDGDEYIASFRATCIYPKDFIMSLRDHPLSRKKPDNIDHINVLVKSYNGYQVPQQVEPPVEEESRKYSKKFLMSLRYAPLSMRRPDCPEHSSSPNLRMQCFKQAREAAAYRHYEKDPLTPPWFPPFTPRRDYDRLHCAMHYKRY